MFFLYFEWGEHVKEGSDGKDFQIGRYTLLKLDYRIIASCVLAVRLRHIYCSFTNHFSDVSSKFSQSGTQIVSLNFVIISLFHCFVGSFLLNNSFTISITLVYNSLSCMLILFHLLLFYQTISRVLIITELFVYSLSFLRLVRLGSEFAPVANIRCYISLNLYAVWMKRTIA